MIYGRLLMVYQVPQSTEEISYHYRHVQMNDLWAATDGISSLSIYRWNKLPLYTCTNEWSMGCYWWYIKSLNLQKKLATIKYRHVQMNYLWAATDGISSLSIYSRNKLPLITRGDPELRRKVLYKFC